MMRALCGVILLGLAAGAAWAQGPPAADPAGLQSAVFALEGVGYRILLPQRASLVPPSGQVKSATIRDATKSQRLERLLILGGARDGAKSRPMRTVRLKGGGVLRYGIEDNVGGGSGGPIGELTGEIEIGSRTLAVTCTDQGELAREPDWCVAYLHHLRMADHQ